MKNKGGPEISHDREEEKDTYVPEVIPPLEIGVLGHRRPRREDFGDYAPPALVGEDPRDGIFVKGFTGEYTDKDLKRTADNRMRHNVEDCLADLMSADGNFWGVVASLSQGDQRIIKKAVLPTRLKDVVRDHGWLPYREALADVASDYSGYRELLEVTSDLVKAIDAMEHVQNGGEVETKKPRIGFN